MSVSFCTRTEKVIFKLQLDKEQADKNKDALEVFGNYLLQDGDILKLNYVFNIDYINGIEENFDALIKLSDNGVIVSADMKELLHGRSLLLELLKKLQTLMGKVK